MLATGTKRCENFAICNGRGSNRAGGYKTHSVTKYCPHTKNERVESSSSSEGEVRVLTGVQPINHPIGQPVCQPVRRPVRPRKRCENFENCHGRGSNRPGGYKTHTVARYCPQIQKKIIEVEQSSSTMTSDPESGDGGSNSDLELHPTAHAAPTPSLKEDAIVPTLNTSMASKINAIKSGSEDYTETARAEVPATIEKLTDNQELKEIILRSPLALFPEHNSIEMMSYSSGKSLMNVDSSMRSITVDSDTSSIKQLSEMCNVKSFSKSESQIKILEKTLKIHLEENR